MCVCVFSEPGYLASGGSILIGRDVLYFRSTYKGMANCTYAVLLYITVHNDTGRWAVGNAPVV